MASVAPPIATSVTASASSPSASSRCDERDLETVRFEQEYVGVSSRPIYHASDAVKAAVIACFEQLPSDRRSTGAVHAVTIEWPNRSFEGSSFGGLGLAGRGRGGGGDYPPKVSDDAFTACVSKVIPKESVSSSDRDASKIQAIKLTVLAYTRGAVDRYLTGAIGSVGTSSGGYGRATRPCEKK